MGSPYKTIDGGVLRDLVEGGEEALSINVEAVNLLNVFPVPDGDTGTNMLLTLRAIKDETSKSPTDDVSYTARAMAKGALLGARGNSGVILSQFFQGMARALTDIDQIDCHVLVLAFLEGSEATYHSVSEPVEGTMLTVIRETADAMKKHELTAQGDLPKLLEIGLQQCQMAVAETPNQLPILKSAGVVDAGGQGFSLFLEGALRRLRGENPTGVFLETTMPTTKVQASFLAAAQSETYGYCTEVMIAGQLLNPDEIRSQISTLAESTVVIGDETLVKVHAHTFDPGSILSFGTSIGTLSQVKVENMDQQHEEFQASHRVELSSSTIGIIATALGAGIEQVLQNLGAGIVIHGGQSMNPSCEEILQAVSSLHTEKTLFLTNNSNIIPVGLQAKELSATPLYIVPTRTIPQGVAALLAFDPDADIETNQETMITASKLVQSGEIVTAVRDATMNGKSLNKGDVLGLWEGELIHFGKSCLKVLQTTLEYAKPQNDSLITLYWGGDVDQDEAERALRHLEEMFPHTEIELVFGGQPSYHYIVSLE